MISFVFICSYQWGQRKRVTRTHFILYDIGLIWSKHLIKIDENRQFRSTSDKIPDKNNFKHKMMLVDNATLDGRKKSSDSNPCFERKSPTTKYYSTLTMPYCNCCGNELNEVNLVLF